MRMLLLRRRDAPWEVVDHKVVQPVPMYYDDEDIDIIALSSSETRGTYVFDLHLGKRATQSGIQNGLVSESRTDGDHWRKALIFARQQLLAEVAKKDYNVLLLEGWRVTVMRKGKLERIEVQYNGRGALAAGKPDLAERTPPFIELLGAA